VRERERERERSKVVKDAAFRVRKKESIYIRFRRFPGSARSSLSIACFPLTGHGPHRKEEKIGGRTGGYADTAGLSDKLPSVFLKYGKRANNT
jgi:hypothetical protein